MKTTAMRIALGCDHGGFAIKEVVRRSLLRRGIEVDDVGSYGTESVDYPDYAREVAQRIVGGRAGEGILVCTTGIGMMIAANKWPNIRAALCVSPEMAVTSRTHNNANVLVLAGGQLSGDGAEAILTAWLDHRFSGQDRHVRRLEKIVRAAQDAADLEVLGARDPEVCDALREEIDRQNSTLNFIASENYVSRAVRVAQSSVMTNKYAEGYPGKRWYNGCEAVDRAETLAIERARTLFGAEHANVQPHCGSSANMAVYLSALDPGDTILAMSLAHGGHLTHGHTANFSGRLFRVVSYGVNPTTERIDFEEVAALAREYRPKLIVAGASAYPRTLDFVRFREAADAVGARLMVDIAHIAGLVATGCHASPVPHAEYVTTTTHKTLRGPRSGLILCRDEFAKDIDRQVFPGIQGGPLMHTIAAKAVCFREAMSPEFRQYSQQIVRNAAAMADALKGDGFRLVSGGTDNHLMLVDLSSKHITGRDAAAVLDRAGIIVNRNSIPFDTRSVFLTSGIRIGTPAATSRGMKETEMREVAGLIARAIARADDQTEIVRLRARARELASQFPVLL